MPKPAAVKARKPAGRRAKAYERDKERARAIAAARSLAGRDIGSIPRVADPKRKKRAARDLRYFCEAYFPETFALAWSDDHLEVIATIERVCLEGGLFAFAMPRGSGKTTLAETGAIWAALYGYRLFSVVIGPDSDHADSMLDTIKTRLVTNDSLLADFPEVCYPLRKIEGIAQRAKGQLCQGKPTLIEWTADRVRLPTIARSRASGAIIAVRGIMGNIRGMKAERADGKSVRPDLVLIDDPQKDETARSPGQCADREAVIAGAVMGLAGPGRKIAGLATVTVICKDDLAERLLDRKRYPQWQGRTMRMLYSLPADEAKWAEYAKIREQSLEEHGDIRDATRFYIRNRSAMDAGSRAAWQARFDPDEASAVQHAMNKKIENAATFWAECQNDPGAGIENEADELTPADIMAKLNRLERWVVPHNATRLTLMIDVQKNALFYAVLAFADDFTGAVIDYGAEPDQGVPYFSYREIRHTLGDLAPGTSWEGAIYAGLDRLADRLFAREWPRDGTGQVMKIERALLDCNWGDGSELTYTWARQTRWSALVTPSHGKYYGPMTTPMALYRKRPGERRGLNWIMPPSEKRAVRHVVFDSNWWKSFVASRLASAMGEPGCLTLWGDAPAAHQLFADHLTAERKFPVTARGRTVDEWKPKHVGRDNHWLDALVGAFVAGSVAGCQPPGGGREVVVRRKRVPLSEMAARAAAKRLARKGAA